MTSKGPGVSPGGDDDPEVAITYLEVEQCKLKAAEAKSMCVPLLEQAEAHKARYDSVKMLAEFWGQIAKAYLMMGGMSKTEAEQEIRSWQPFRE